MGNGTRCISLSNRVPVGLSRDPSRNCLASWPADLARSGARASLLSALSSLRAPRLSQGRVRPSSRSQRSAQPVTAAAAAAGARAALAPGLPEQEHGLWLPQEPSGGTCAEPR